VDLKSNLTSSKAISQFNFTSSKELKPIIKGERFTTPKSTEILSPVGKNKEKSCRMSTIIAYN